MRCSTLTMQSQSHMPLCGKRTPPSSHQPLRMRPHSQCKTGRPRIPTKSVKETMRWRMASAIQNVKRPMTPMKRRWKSTTKRSRHSKARPMASLVCRIVRHLQLLSASRCFPGSGRARSSTADIGTPTVYKSTARGDRRCALGFISTVCARPCPFLLSCLSPSVCRYQGFQSTHVVQSPTPNAAGVKVKMAQVLFDSPELSSAAKEALDGFTLKKGWLMSVAYI